MRKTAHMRALIVAATLVLAQQTQGAATADFLAPIHVSPDGHFLAGSKGEPFFWLGDTAWDLFDRTDRAEAEAYLLDRTHKGFTVVQVSLLPLFLGANGVGMGVNRFGEIPFIRGEFSQPNPRYFEQVDWIVERAAQLGLHVAIVLAWGSTYVDVIDTRSKTDAPKTFSTLDAEGFARWVSSRYRHRGVIWILGGDTTPVAPRLGYWKNAKGEWQVVPRPVEVVDYRAVYDSMAKGISEGDANHPLITYHISGSSNSGTALPRTSLYFQDRHWLDVNMLQSGHYASGIDVSQAADMVFRWNGTLNYEPVLAEYNSVPVRPIVDGEARFEDLAINTQVDANGDAVAGYWSGTDARNAAYHAVFAGAAGHTYGNGNLWQFYDPTISREYQTPRKQYTWRQVLDRPISHQLQYLKALMLSRPYFSRIPDQSVLVGETGEGTAHVSGTRDKTGAYILVFSPTGQPVTVDLNKVSGDRARAWWFDPRTGKATQIEGEFPTTGVKRFVAPSSGLDEDWVLVIDDESKGFAAPGTNVHVAGQS